MTCRTVWVHGFKAGAVAGGAVAASGEVLVIGTVGFNQAAFRVMTVVA